jgi:hypothetical protein
MFRNMQHGYGYAILTQTCSMDMNRDKQHVHTFPCCMLISMLHNGTKAELGDGGGANWAKNDAPYILVFTAILSFMEHVRTFIGRY